MTHISGHGLSFKLLRVETGKASHKGMVRTSNEDSLLTLELGLGLSPASIAFSLYAVADGVGGHEGGEIASGLALRVLAQNMVKSLLQRFEDDSSTLDQEYILQALADVIRIANAEVYVQSQVQGNAMGTTLAAALVIGNRAYIANVGDSRVYSLVGEQLRQVTDRKSVV